MKAITNDYHVRSRESNTRRSTDADQSIVRRHVEIWDSRFNIVET